MKRLELSTETQDYKMEEEPTASFFERISNVAIETLKEVNELCSKDYTDCDTQIILMQLYGEFLFYKNAKIMKEEFANSLLQALETNIKCVNNMTPVQRQNIVLKDEPTLYGVDGVDAVSPQNEEFRGVEASYNLSTPVSVNIGAPGDPAPSKFTGMYEKYMEVWEPAYANAKFITQLVSEKRLVHLARYIYEYSVIRTMASTTLGFCMISNRVSGEYYNPVLATSLWWVLTDLERTFGVFKEPWPKAKLAGQGLTGFFFWTLYSLAPQKLINSNHHMLLTPACNFFSGAFFTRFMYGELTPSNVWNVNRCQDTITGAFSFKSFLNDKTIWPSTVKGAFETVLPTSVLSFVEHLALAITDLGRDDIWVNSLKLWHVFLVATALWYTLLDSQYRYVPARQNGYLELNSAETLNGHIKSEKKKLDDKHQELNYTCRVPNLLQGRFLILSDEHEKLLDRRESEVQRVTDLEQKCRIVSVLLTDIRQWEQRVNQLVADMQGVINRTPAASARRRRLAVDTEEQQARVARAARSPPRRAPAP